MKTRERSQTELIELIEQGAQLALARREGELSDQELAAATGGAQGSLGNVKVNVGLSGKVELLQLANVAQLNQQAAY